MDKVRQAEILKEPCYDLGMSLLGKDQRNASTQSIAMGNHYSSRDRRYFADDERMDSQLSTFLQPCFGDSFS